MKFKINLEPYPGAPYFTVQEHLRTYTNSQEINHYLKKIGDQGRKLFGIPESYQIELLKLSEKKNLLNRYESVIIKDSPETGFDELNTVDSYFERPSMVDFSYSFPQIPSLESCDFDSVIIDPNASLGVASDYLLVFNCNTSNAFDKTAIDVNEESYRMTMYILTMVMHDLEQKGIDILVRESNYKAAVLHHLIESNPSLQPIPGKKNKSKTMISAICEVEFLKKIEKLGYTFYKRTKKNLVTLTIANYPTHSKELIEMFADRVALL